MDFRLTNQKSVWPIVLAIVASIAFACAYFFGVLLPRSKSHAEDLSVGSYQISAATEQFFLEHPERIFATYDDLIGPDRYLQSAPASVSGEDYHELFPLRRDCEALTVTMGDGRRVIVFLTPNRELGRSSVFLRQMPNGRLSEVNEGLGGAGLALYQRWLEGQHKPDGVQVKILPDGRRYEITYRAGVPDGPFRAYYADDKLWAEANYAHGMPFGRHRIFNEAGQVTYETSLP